MNALAAPVPSSPASKWTMLRTVLAAGTVSNILLPLSWLCAFLPLLNLGKDKDMTSIMALVLTGVMVAFWTTVTGIRLIALTLHAAQLRLPRVRLQALYHGMTALLLVVLIPALLLTLAGSYSLAINLLGLTLAVLASLLWISEPPWLMLTLAVAAPALLLPTMVFTTRQIDAHSSVTYTVSLLLFFAVMLILMLAGLAWCWRYMARHRHSGLGWSTALPLILANGSHNALTKVQQSQFNSSWLTANTPISHDLLQQPQLALGIAVGPGFGRATLKNFLLSQSTVWVVAALWLLLAISFGESGHNAVHRFALLYAPILALFAPLIQTMRLLALTRTPAMGLHELALLPGLPHPAAPALSTLLMRQMLLNFLPALAAIAGVGLLLDAPRPFYPLLFWSGFAGLMWLHGIGLGLFASRNLSSVVRNAKLALITLFAVAVAVSMGIGLRDHPPSWLLPAWYMALIAGTFVSVFAQYRLRKLPHPWLQN